MEADGKPDDVVLAVGASLLINEVAFLCRRLSGGFLVYCTCGGL